MAVPDYFGFFYLGVLHVHAHVHCARAILQRAPLGNLVFPVKSCHVFWNRKFTSFILRGGYAMSSQKFALYQGQQDGCVRTLKYQGGQETSVVCGPYIIKVRISIYGE